MQPLILAIDIDGTIIRTEKDYVPRALVLNAKEVINWAYNKGCYIILWTCRSGEMLQQAIDFINQNNINFHVANENYEKINFETSRKIYSDYYIDDKSFEINWIEIKKNIIKKIFEKLADEIEELAKELKEM